MRITRHYGQTRATGGERILIPKTDDKKPIKILDLDKEYPELLIAQWISILDKIATKPKSDKKPFKAQRCFRQKLGDAFWQKLDEHISGLNLDEKKKSNLEALWKQKLHP